MIEEEIDDDHKLTGCEMQDSFQWLLELCRVFLLIIGLTSESS